MTQLEVKSQLDIVVAVVEIVVAEAEIVVAVEDFLESQMKQVFDNKLETFQGLGSCMAQAVLSAFSAED